MEANTVMRAFLILALLLWSTTAEADTALFTITPPEAYMALFTTTPPEAYGCDRDAWVREELWPFVLESSQRMRSNPEWGYSVVPAGFKDVVCMWARGCKARCYTVETFPRESVECSPGVYLVLWDDDKRCWMCC